MSNPVDSFLLFVSISGNFAEEYLIVGKVKNLNIDIPREVVVFFLCKLCSRDFSIADILVELTSYRAVARVRCPAASKPKLAVQPDMDRR